jgi:predicted phage-related endonuclease
MMERICHELTQGSDAWDQFRLDHNGASEAAAMLGISGKTKRGELLRMKHTGIAKEFSEWVQSNVLDHGHKVEAMARPLVEKMLGEDLYPATYSFGKMSASCDGLTMDGETAFEHKQWNAELAASLCCGILPDEYQPQCQQIMHVTGAKRVIFVCSDGTNENFEYLEILPDPEWVERIVAGWNQFDRDLIDYVPQVEAPKPVAAPIAELPALTVELVGQVTNTNLAEWQGVVTYRIQAINTDLKTDQDFADAENMVKFLENGEKTLELVKAQALSQTSTIDELFRAIDSIKAEMRTKRLELGRTVEAKKQSIRNEIEQEGQKALAAYVAELNARVGGYMPIIKADFFGRMKGKRTVATLRDAMETALANGKIDADRFAGLIEKNLECAAPFIQEFGTTLFYDLKHIVTKETDAFEAIVKLRVSEHRQKLEAEASAKADAIAKAEAEAAAKAATAANQTQYEQVKELVPNVLSKIEDATIAGAISPELSDSLRNTVGAIAADSVINAAMAPANDSGPTMKLGEICAKLGFTVSADFLDQLGIHAKTEKNAKLYPASKFPTICRLISDHVLALAFKKAA